MPRPALLALFACALPAQTATWFEPAGDWLLRLDTGELPALGQRLQQTGLGGLWRDDAVREFAAALRATLAPVDPRRRELVALAVRLGGVLDASEMLADAVLELAPTDLRRVTATVHLDASLPWPQPLLVLEPTPAANGRLVARAHRLQQELAGSADVLRVDAPRLAGFDVAQFALREAPEPFFLLPPFVQQPWLLALPQQIVYGNGAPASSGRMQQERPPLPAAGVELACAFPPGAPAAFGIDLRGPVLLQADAADGRVESRCSLLLASPRSGLAGALCTATAPLPPQPLPEGAVLQVRCSVALEQALPALQPLVSNLLPLPGIPLPATDAAELQKAFTGGVAFGLGAPAAGGLLPRLWLSLGVADADAATQLFARLAQQSGFTPEAAEVAGVACTQLQRQNLPAALQPCFAIVGDALHLAESTASLRALLRQLQADTPSTLAADAPLPQAPGRLLPTFDVRFDPSPLLPPLYRTWLPALRLAAPQPLRELLDEDVLPPLATLQQHVGPGRGGLFLDGDRLVYAESSPIGGPALLGAVLLTAASLSFDPNARAEDRGDLARRIGRRRLELFGQVLRGYREAHGRPPADLGELVAAGVLAGDALWIPGDEAAQPIAGTTLRSSFRYLGDGVPVRIDGGADEAIIVAVEATPARPDGPWLLLAASGEVYDEGGGRVRRDLAAADR